MLREVICKVISWFIVEYCRDFTGVISIHICVSLAQVSGAVSPVKYSRKIVFSSVLLKVDCTVLLYYIDVTH
jgi:hypothetical protein